MEKHSIIIQTAFLGDALLSIPLIQNYKRLYPNHKLSFLCRKGLGDFFRNLNLVDHVYELNKKSPEDFKATLQELKKVSWCHVLCPHESIRSHKVAMSLKAEYKVGFKNFYNFFIFDKTIKRPMHLPDALRQLSLLSLLSDLFKSEFDVQSLKNLSTQEVVNFKQQSQIPTQYSMSLDVKPQGQNKDLHGAVFIAPGSVWATKRWTLEGFSELIKQLKTEKVCLVGSPNEQEICEQLKAQHPEVINLCGKTSLTELAELLSNAKCLFCNDSGTMHVASVVNCPTVSVFGPTTLDLGYRPWNNKAIVVQKPLSCRPCGKHGHQKCPIGTHECMKSISGLEVYQEAQKLIPTIGSPSH